jgi:hypothetical protein
MIIEDQAVLRSYDSAPCPPPPPPKVCQLYLSVFNYTYCNFYYYLYEYAQLRIIQYICNIVVCRVCMWVGVFIIWRGWRVQHTIWSRGLQYDRFGRNSQQFIAEFILWGGGGGGIGVTVRTKIPCQIERSNTDYCYSRAIVKNNVI